ncbi:type II secretion system F family protein [Carboxydocella sp. JDF658]|uniref:type II secretion system F family protein n=1 Tax=Carboxydocella sp. JDF658 TaxID=1926600 RepID=UPI0009AE4FFB|nr:type II secretion system F family protein [Carboxydocella sp. JDF658]GAW31846.1 type II secretion system F domain-containing protein [Carboxydocella sp. JDF658]
MELLISLLSGLSFTLLSYVFLFHLYRDKITVQSRLQQVGSLLSWRKKYLDEKLSQPFFERVIRPLLNLVAEKLPKGTRAADSKQKLDLQKKLLMAGNPWDLTAGEYLALQYAMMIGLALVCFFLALPSGASPLVLVLALLLGAILGYLLPNYYLGVLATRRQEEIQDTLPDILDLLTVSVEAGLGFDAALVKVVEKSKGVLAEEFSRLLQEIKMGKPRRDALRDLGLRSGNEDLQTLVGAIIQADQLGVSIGNVLRLQSAEMRGKRKQRAEEKAMKAPVKMLIPMVLFIFPTLFVVLLGPAIMQMMKTMGN